jgi:hypothetical protein
MEKHVLKGRFAIDESKDKAISYEIVFRGD